MIEMNAIELGTKEEKPATTDRTANMLRKNTFKRIVHHPTTAIAALMIIAKLTAKSVAISIAVPVNKMEGSVKNVNGIKNIGKAIEIALNPVELGSVRAIVEAAYAARATGGVIIERIAK